MSITLWILLYVFVWTLPPLVLGVIHDRKQMDITYSHLIQGLFVCMVFGLIATVCILIALIGDALKSKPFDKVIFKKCTKKEVWSALGGKEENGPR